MENQLKRETGKQFFEMALCFLDDKFVIQGFVKKLGDIGMRKIINEYTPEYLNKMNAENAITNADKILDIIRNIQLIEDVNLRLFMQAIKGVEKTQNLYKFCCEIITQRIKKNMGISQQSKQEGCTIDLTAIKEIEELKKIQKNIIDYIDCPDNIEENFRNLFSDIVIHDNKQKMKDFLMFINNISLYHFRKDYFMEKIEKLILYFKDDIKNSFSNYEIFKIFKGNLRVTLFLSKEKIIDFDDNQILSWYNDERYFYYFYPEFKAHIQTKKYQQVKIDDNNEQYESKRKTGENDTYICELIRKDSIDDFISYVKNNNTNLDSYIKKSFYETNQMLLENEKVSLIQYAVFFGSIRIFKYLSVKGVKIEKSILKFAIHGENCDIINMIIDSDSIVETIDQTDAEELLLTTIQCFEIDLFNYIKTIVERLFENTEQFDSFCLKYSLKYRNYNICSKPFLYDSETILPKYDCYLITEYIVKTNQLYLENMFTNSLIYSSYEYINLIYTARNNKKSINDVDFDDITECIEKGKASDDAKDKIMLFIRAYNLGLNTKEKYTKIYGDESLNDEFTKFLEICDGKYLPSIEELINEFVVGTSTYQQQQQNLRLKLEEQFPDISSLRFTQIFTENPGATEEQLKQVLRNEKKVKTSLFNNCYIH